MLPDMSAQFTLPDGIEKGPHFLFFAGGQKLDPAVAQVPHGSGDIEPFRYMPDRIAEADPLDIAFVKNLNGSGHATGRLIRHFADGNRAARFIVPAQGREDRQANPPAEARGADRWN